MFKHFHVLETEFYGFVSVTSLRKYIIIVGNFAEMFHILGNRKSIC